MITVSEMFDFKFHNYYLAWTEKLYYGNVISFEVNIQY